jgi:hypothetical protein
MKELATITVASLRLRSDHGGKVFVMLTGVYYWTCLESSSLEILRRQIRGNRPAR